MTTRTWSFTLDGQTHRLELRHGAWGGLRELRLNDQLVERSRKLLDYGSYHRLPIGSHTAEVFIVPGVWSFQYWLFINGQPQAPSQTTKQPDRWLKQYLSDRADWLTLAEVLGLAYRPAPVASGPWLPYHHRLLGWRHGYLVLAFPTLAHSRPPLERVAVVLRHARPLDFEQYKQQLLSDPALRALLAKPQEFPFEIQPEHVILTFHLPSKKRPVPQLADQMQAALAAVARYARPLSPNECDAERCRRPDGQPRPVVLINRYPMRLCAECQVELPALGDKHRNAYHAAPSRLGPALAAGVAAMVVGAIILAVVTVVFKTVAAVFAALIYTLVVRAMNRVGVKTTRLSLALAAGLALVGVGLGTYLMMLYFWLSQGPWPASLPALLLILRGAWESVWSEPRLTGLMFSFGTIGIVIYWLLGWLDLNASLKSHFRPTIEVVGHLDVA